MWAGFAPECGRTNNGLESHNRQLKERDFLRRRVPIREFLVIAPSNMKVASLSPEHQVLPRFCLEISKDVIQNPSLRPTITVEIYKKAYELVKSMRPYIEIENDEAIIIPSRHGLEEFGTQESADSLVQIYLRMHSENYQRDGFEGWEEYKATRSKFHCVRRSEVWDGLFSFNFFCIYYQNYIFTICFRLLFLQLLASCNA